MDTSVWAHWSMDTSVWAHWSMDTSLCGHIGPWTHRCGHIGPWTHHCVDTLVRGHIGVGTLVHGHIGMGTHQFSGSTWTHRCESATSVKLTYPAQETDSSAHLDSSSSRFHLHSPQSALPLFLKITRPHALFTLRLLSKEACLYVGADWLRSSAAREWREISYKHTRSLSRLYLPASCNTRWAFLFCTPVLWCIQANSVSWVQLTNLIENQWDNFSKGITSFLNVCQR